MELCAAKDRLAFRLPLNVIAELDSLSAYFGCKNRTDAVCRVIQELFTSLYVYYFEHNGPAGCLVHHDIEDYIDAALRSLKPLDLGSDKWPIGVLCDHTLSHEM